MDVTSGMHEFMYTSRPHHSPTPLDSLGMVNLHQHLLVVSNMGFDTR